MQGLVASGGSEVHSRILANELARVGYEVSLLELRRHGNTAGLPPIAGDVEEITPRRALGALVTGSRVWDIVHSHLLRADYFACLVRIAGRARVWIRTVHGQPYDRSETSPLRQFLYRLSIERGRRPLAPDRTLFVSDFLLRRFGHRLPPGEVGTIGNPLVPFSRLPARRPGTQTVGWMGGLVPVRRPLLFLELLARLPGWSGRMAGSGTLASEVGSQVERLGLAPRLSRLPHESREDFFDQVDCLVVTANGEGFGLAVIEALERGRPVYVLQDSGGPAEILASLGREDWIAADVCSLARLVEARGVSERPIDPEALAPYRLEAWALRYRREFESLLGRA